MSRSDDYLNRRRLTRDGGRNPGSFYRHQSANMMYRYGPEHGQEPDFEQLTDPEHLIGTFVQLQEAGDKAPGPDGIRYSDPGRREVAETMRDLSRRLRNGEWLPGAARTSQMPKKSGPGMRLLRIRSIFTSIVSKVLHDGLQSFWDVRFHDNSYAYRPRRGINQLLAKVLWTCRQTRNWVIMQADISNAFEHVDVNAVLRLHRQHLQSEPLLQLIETLLRCAPNGQINRVAGVDQGGAYSVHCLNTRLHEIHDVHIKDDVPGWWRYSDDLTYLCKSVSEGRKLLADVEQLFSRTEFSLKRTVNDECGTVRDLQRGECVKLLGFIITLHNDRLRFEVCPTAWDGLRTNLQRSHETSDPAVSAQHCVDGWITAYGPALESAARPTVLHGVLKMLRSCGFRDCAGWDGLMQTAARSYRLWKSCIRRAKPRSGGIGRRSAHANDPDNRNSACPQLAVQTMDCLQGEPL